ncbi:MAG: hypothetical protein II784_02040 [Oscillospiraceae bacterium]|nr:hypothetical protein [Oscillospiraceae bacterium]
MPPAPDFAVMDEDFGAPASARPADEFPAPAPELILPGAYPHAPSSSGGRRKKLLFYILSIALLLVCLLGGARIFGRNGSSADDLSAAVNAEAEARPAATEQSPQSEIKEQPPVPSSGGEEPTVPVQQSEPAESAKEEPSCELIYIAFSAQQLGKVLFEGPADIVSAKLEIRDILTGDVEYTYDIPREAIDEREYVIEPFWTQEIYDRHREEYEAASAYPESTNATVTMEYKTDSGTETMTVSRDSAPEQGWSISYWSEDTPANDWNHPGCFALRSYESFYPLRVLYNKPEKVRRPGVISVLMEADGQQFETLYSESYSEKEEGYTYYDASGKEIDISFYYSGLVIPRPASLEEGKGRTAHFYVTQYLENFDMVYTTKLDVEY